MTAPNVIWTADYKGAFRLGNGQYCYPLTVQDGFGRYLLACRALTGTTTVECRPVFERLFQEYGLPEILRIDNGVPFATMALGRLSQLSVWWIRLGIYPELIEPAHPEQNGRHERMHRTLKWATTRPPAPSRRRQQAGGRATKGRDSSDRAHPNGHQSMRGGEDSAYWPCRGEPARARRGRSVATSTASGDDSSGHLARHFGVRGAPIGVQRRNRRLSDRAYEGRRQPDDGRAKDRTRRGTGDGRPHLRLHVAKWTADLRNTAGHLAVSGTQ